MSDTPRTDAHQAASLRSGGRSVALGENAYWLCRKLERELRGAQARLQWFRENQNQIAMDVMRPVEEENARLQIDLEKVRAANVGLAMESHELQEHMARLLRAVSRRMQPDDPTPEDRLEMFEAWKQASDILSKIR
jgi:hypothetical protein